MKAVRARAGAWIETVHDRHHGDQGAWIEACQLAARGEEKNWLSAGISHPYLRGCGSSQGMSIQKALAFFVYWVDNKIREHRIRQCEKPAERQGARSSVRASSRIRMGVGNLRGRRKEDLRRATHRGDRIPRRAVACPLFHAHRGWGKDHQFPEGEQAGGESICAGSR